MTGVQTCALPISLSKGKSIYFDMKYRYGRLGESSAYGWYLPFDKKEDEVIMKLIDNAGRRLKGNTELKINVSLNRFQKFIADKLDEWVKAGGRDPYVETKIRISKDTLMELRKSSDEVREALKTEEDEIVEIREPISIPVVDDYEEEEGFIPSLDEVEREILRILIEGGNPDKVLERNYTTLDVVVDSLNDKALDAFGESIIQDSEIVPGYEYLVDEL